MKKHIFIIIFAFCALSFANKIIKQAMPLPIYLQIYHTPVFVYGTISDVIMDDDNNITAKLSVKQTIKGDIDDANVLTVSFPAVSDKRAPVGTRPKTTTFANQTCIFGLYRNNQKEWVTDTHRFYVNTAEKVDISGRIFSLSDFKVGIALFEQKFTYFNEKKANNIKISLENPTQNQTFAFLAKEMMGELIYTPKIAHKTQKGKVKPSKKRK